MSRVYLERTVDGSALVLARVAQVSGFTVEQLAAPGRADETLARARHVAAWFLRGGGRSSAEVGRVLGGRDESTIRNSCRLVEATLLSADDALMVRLVLDVARAKLAEMAAA